MSTMNISLPQALKTFVDEQVEQRGFGTSSEYVRDLLRKEQERSSLRDVMLRAAESPVVAEMGPQYFGALRASIRKPTTR